MGVLYAASLVLSAVESPTDALDTGSIVVLFAQLVVSPLHIVLVEALVFVEDVVAVALVAQFGVDVHCGAERVHLLAFSLIQVGPSIASQAIPCLLVVHAAGFLNWRAGSGFAGGEEPVEALLA